MATSWWTMTSNGCSVTDDITRAAYDLTGARKSASSVRTIADPDAATLAAWDAEAVAKLAEMAPERIAKQQRETALVGAIKAKFGGICAATGKRYERGAMIKRYGSGWALASATISPAVNDEFAADEPTVRDDAQLMVREMAMEIG